MATLTITPTYQSLDILYEADLDSIRLPLQEFLNVTGLEASNLAPETLTADLLAPAVQNVITQTGMMFEFYGTTLPEGFLWCNGALFTTAEHPELYAVIATTYGGSPGVNFNVPDKRDRVSVGRDNMGGSAANRITSAGCDVNGDTIGAAGGAQDLSEHAHPVGSVAVAAGTHTHTLTDPTHGHTLYRASNTPTVSAQQSRDSVGNDGTGPGTYIVNQVAQVQAVNAGLTYGTTGATHTHSAGGGTSGSAGTKTELSVVQPSIVCNYIIKA